MYHKNSTPAKRRPFFRRSRHRTLRYVAVLPSLITLLNGLFGFAAIVFASRGYANQTERLLFHKISMPWFAISGYMIFLAMIADMLDGRVARMSHSTSSFGGQLDSLCDIISFGIAPAFLTLALLENTLSNLFTQNLLLSNYLTRFIWLSSAVYFACAAIRLARFNVENEEDETAHMSFTGLPSPAAAGVIASFVVFYQDKLPEFSESGLIFDFLNSTVIYLLPFAAIAAGVLMVSRIRFPHVVNQYLRGRKPMTHFLWVLGTLALIHLCGIQIALVIAFWGFALSGSVKFLWRKIFTHHTRSVPAEQQCPAQPAHNPDTSV